jgi:small subunit ribosomal protein S7
MMKHGKKAAAEKAFYGAMTEIEKQGADPLETFRVALDNAKPMLEVKSRRVGGSNYQVPVEIRPERRQALAIRWLIEFSRKRSGRSMKERLAGEIVDAANKRGATIKRREDVHKMAEANKAFAHYRW